MLAELRPHNLKEGRERSSARFYTSHIKPACGLPEWATHHFITNHTTQSRKHTFLQEKKKKERNTGKKYTKLRYFCSPGDRWPWRWGTMRAGSGKEILASLAGGVPIEIICLWQNVLFIIRNIIHIQKPKCWEGITSITMTSAELLSCMHLFDDIIRPFMY